MFNEVPTNEMRGKIFADLFSSMMSDALKDYHAEHHSNTVTTFSLDEQVKQAVQEWSENERDIEKMIESAIGSSCSYGEIDSAIDEKISNIDFQDAFNDCELENSAYVSRETFDELKESVETLKAELVAVQAVYSALVIIKANLQN
jgi:hypothetical protein